MEDWKIQNIATLANGKKAKDISPNFKYPIYGGNGILGYSNSYNESNVVIIGRVGAYCGSVHYSKEKCWISDNAISAKTKDENNNQYLYYLLTSLKLNRYHIGGAQPLMTQGIINNIDIPHHSLSIQKKIAGILSALDEKIETNRKINARLEEMAQAIFKSWLTTCKDRVKIGELCSNILDYTPNLSPKVRLINSADITEGRFDDYPLVENKNLKGHFKKRFRREDILYSEIRPRNHHYGYALIDGDEYVVSTRFMVIRNLPDKVTSAILYQYLLLPEVEADFTAKTESRSGTFPQGTYKDLATIEVPYSSNQNYIDAILRLVRHKIFSLQKESVRLAELRDTLLPKLMSGEIKV